MLRTARKAFPSIPCSKQICIQQLFYGAPPKTKTRATSPHSLQVHFSGSASAYLTLARNSVSRHRAMALLPAYRELNFICPQVEQVHHCRSISVAQNSQRHVGGGAGRAGAGAGAGADTAPDADVDAGALWAVCSVSRLFVFFFGGLSVRSITAGLGPGCLGVAGTCNVASPRSTPQASQHKKSCGLCNVHTEQIQNRSSLGRGGTGGLLLIVLVLLPLLLPTPGLGLGPSNDTVLFPLLVIIFSAGDEVTYEPPALAISSSWAISHRACAMARSLASSSSACVRNPFFDAVSAMIRISLSLSLSVAQPSRAFVRFSAAAAAAWRRFLPGLGGRDISPPPSRCPDPRLNCS